MPLSKEQFMELRAKGLSVDQIVKFESGEKPQQEVVEPQQQSGGVRALNAIGSVAGLDVLGKKIGGNIAKLIPIPKVVAPVNYQGTQNQFQKEQQRGYQQDISKEMPTTKQTLGAAGKLGLTLGTLGTGSVATGLGLKGGAALATRVAEGGIIGGAFTALDNVSKGEAALKKNVGMGVAIGGAIPLAGAAIKGFSKKASEIIERTLIKPSKVDLEDGFNVSNIQKYNLGGNLKQTLEKTDKRLQELTSQLYGKLKSRADATIDLNEVANRTAQDILKNKSRYFGDVGGVKRVLQNLASEIEDTSKNGLVDLVEAQAIKQSAGQKGAWVYGFIDPDAKATEMVYTKFYRQLRQEIEKKAPAGIREINKQIGELIPISHAVIRRIPVAERNNILSLTDVISGGFAIGNPKSVGLFLLNRLTKSGMFANMLGKVGKFTPKTRLGERILGR